MSDSVNIRLHCKLFECNKPDGHWALFHVPECTVMRVLQVCFALEPFYLWVLCVRWPVHSRKLLGPALLGRVLAWCCKNDIWSICLVVIWPLSHCLSQKGPGPFISIYILFLMECSGSSPYLPILDLKILSQHRHNVKASTHMHI
jgi:hypothetical protein